jgi:cytochrome P450
MTSAGPVLDWTNDYDLFDDTFVTEPYPIYAELRESCPVARTERWGGSWMPTRYDDIAAVAHDTTHFSSRNVGVTGLEGASPLTAPPITSDPPFHADARRLLLPAFSPKAVDRLEPLTRGIARELLDLIDGRPTADAAIDYAQHIPVRVIALMLGVDAADEARFTDWAVRVIQVGPTDREVGRTATREVLDYFRTQVEARRGQLPAAADQPDGAGDDLISYLLQAELEGAPLTERHILGTCFLLLLAGIDTTWSSIGASLWHLATHPADRERLVADPSLIPMAIEEMLRAYAPVTMAREVVAETTVGGRTVRPGDRVLLTLPSGNRDPGHFDRPDEVIIDRAHNRHFAFGVGIHRCIGSNLARMELRVAIEEWLARVPDFHLVPGAHVEWNGGQVRGPRTVPVIIG